MGIIAHHAIVVTGSYGTFIDRAHMQAEQLFAESMVTPIGKGITNGVQSFAVLPDGSKEGWAESEACNDSRDRFVVWLEAQKYEDGSSPLSWVEVHYGEISYDERGAEVTRSAWATDAEKGACSE